jgi:hypothetical protein
MNFPERYRVKRKKLTELSLDQKIALKLIQNCMNLRFAQDRQQEPPSPPYYHRSLITRIGKTDIQFWASWGSWGCREKNPNCHDYATFPVVIFSWPQKNSKFI